MIRLIFLLLLAIALPNHILAQSPECDRPLVEDMEEYKTALTPELFSAESFSWEIADIAVLALMLLLSGVLSLRHLPKCRFTSMMVIALLYFGLFRGGCICPVGATSNILLGLRAPEMVGKTVALLFLLPLVAAFLFGRVFCSSACPLGAVQHLLARKKSIEIPLRLLRILRLLPIGVLLATIWAVLRSSVFLACRLDPYKNIFFTGHAWINQAADAVGGTIIDPRFIWIGDLFSWLMLAALLVLGFFVHRPFCRFVCPYGVLLGLFSSIGLRRRTIDPASCFACTLCTKTCPTQAITADREKRSVTVSNFHCIQCGRCDETCKSNSLETPSPYSNSRFPNIAKKRATKPAVTEG
ncbi:MAG: 4Fe-4S binding protein [Pontiellaceae bacterium]|nr:4Fe-4S binding protein [Pontiellaceae bacterium]